MVGRDGTDHIFLVNKDKYEYLNASYQPLTYFQRSNERCHRKNKHRNGTRSLFQSYDLAINAQLNAKYGNIK